MASAAFAWQFAFGLYRSIYNNFLVETHGIAAHQLGALESIREIPGLATVVLVALVAGLTPSRVAAACCAMIAAGLFLYPSAGGMSHLIAITLVFSTGFHLIFPAQNALVLHHAGEGEKGRTLGRLESVEAVASLTAMGVAALFAVRLSFGGLFYVAAAAALVGMAGFLRTPGPRRLSERQPNLGFSRSYTSYYVMTLLQGARRHFFLVFALFNLVAVYGVPVSVVAALLAVSGSAAVLTRPYLGRLADRYGDTRVLAWCFALVTLVFIGYAFIHDLRVLYVLFCLDSILTFELVIVLHAYRTAGGTAVASVLAGGSTVGHITGVLVPVAGGLLWTYAGPAVAFLTGAGVCLFGFVYAVMVRRRELRA